MLLQHPFPVPKAVYNDIKHGIYWNILIAAICVVYAILLQLCVAFVIRANSWSDLFRKLEERNLLSSVLLMSDIAIGGVFIMYIYQAVNQYFYLKAIKIRED